MHVPRNTMAVLLFSASLLLLLMSILVLLPSVVISDINSMLNTSISTSSNPNFILSQSGTFAFGFYAVNRVFLVGIWIAPATDQKPVIWVANRDETPYTDGAVIAFEAGRFIIRRSSQDNSGSSLYNIASGPGVSAMILDSGNLVVYDASSNIIWKSFNYPTDTLVPGQVLITEKELFSGKSAMNPTTGRFRLKMQDDGNLVMYPVNTYMLFRIFRK